MSLGGAGPSIVGGRSLGRVGILALALAVDLVLWGFTGRLPTGGDIPVPLVLASAVAVFVLLYFRDRWPRLAFAGAWAHCVIWGALVGPYQPFTAVLVALYEIARHLPLRQALWFLLLAVVPVVINTRDAITIGRGGPADTVLVGLIWGVIVGTSWVAGRWGRRAEQAARWREEKLAAEAALARQNERLTLARELHDIVAHSVGSIIFQAAGARHVAQADPPRAVQSLEVIQACGVRAVEELRDLLGMLNAAADAGRPVETSPHLGLGEIESLVELTRLSGVAVELRRVGEPGALNPHADHTAYRLVQESLTNAVKHSGDGLRIEVTVDWRPGWVEIGVVSSSASGPLRQDGESGGYGLAGMRHRVASVGGQVEAGWQADRTFCVHARIPAASAAGRDQGLRAHGEGGRS